MKNFSLIIATLPVGEILREISPLPWEKDAIRNSPQSPHREAEGILLRFHDIKGMTNPEEILRIMFHRREVVYFPAWYGLPSAQNLVFTLMLRLGATRLGKVMLTKLPSGGVIHPHKDEGRYAEYYSRFHVCLAGGDGNEFIIEDEIQTMRTGEIWQTANTRRHTVVNNMPTDRIHLIIDLRLEN